MMHTRQSTGRWQGGAWQRVTKLVLWAAMGLASPQGAWGQSPAPGAGANAAPPLDCGLNTGQRATGEPIYLGGIVSKTGPDDFSASGAAANAYFRCVNDNGGIHGRPIVYTLADDQWNPKLAHELANRLLRERQVLAMVGGSSFVECSANADLYRQNGIVALVGTGVPRACFHSPHVAPINTGPRLSAVAAAAHAAKGRPVKRVACVVHRVPDLSDWACGGVADWAKRQGMAFAQITFDNTAFDAGVVMGQAAADKPDLIVMNVPKGLLIPLMAAAERLDLGASAQFASSTPAYNPDVAKALGRYWKGRIVTHLEFLPIDSTGPDNQNWRAVMNRYALRTDTRDAFSQSGYLAARVVTQALLTLKPQALTRANVNDAIRRLRDFKSDMLCQPFYVGNGKRHNANHSGPVAEFSGSDWTIAAGGCVLAPDPELADVLADEKRMGSQRR